MRKGLKKVLAGPHAHQDVQLLVDLGCVPSENVIPDDETMPAGFPQQQPPAPPRIGQRPEVGKRLTA